MIQYFTDAVTNHYFDFNGRTRRTAFWYFVLVYFIIAVVLGIIQSVAHLGSILTALLSLALLLPNLGIAVRRLHDTNRSGWWILIGLIPIIGWIVLIIWYCEAGTTGSNQFGPDPKAA
jgi:uncharacterized membrane protein YhaH (DUF805 family)